MYHPLAAEDGGAVRLAECQAPASLDSVRPQATFLDNGDRGVSLCRSLHVFSEIRYLPGRRYSLSVLAQNDRPETRPNQPSIRGGLSRVFAWDSHVLDHVTSDTSFD